MQDKPEFKIRVQDITKLVIVTLLMLLLFCIITIVRDNTYTKEKDIKKYNDNWYLNDEKITSTNDEITINTNDICYTLSTEITNEMLGKTLEFKTNHQMLKVYAGDKMIYEVKKPTNDLVNSPCIVYNFINIPIDSEGQKLKIEVEKFYSDDNIIYTQFFLGDKYDIITYLLFENWIDIFANSSIIILGLTLLFSYILIRKYVENAQQLLLLGMFAINIAIWSVSESYILYHFIPNPSVVYLLCYGCLFAFPIFLILFIRNQISDNIIHNNKAKIIEVVCVAHVVIVSLIYMLQIFDIADFTKTIYIFHGVLLFEIILITIISYITMPKNKISIINVIKKITPYLLLGIALIYDFIQFNINRDYTWIYCRLWIYLYLMITVKSYTKFLLKHTIDLIESKHLKEIAYTDALTGINNRNAFITKLTSVSPEESGIISFDVNGLKYYNDNFGHDKGDELLTSMADTLKKVFADDVYRMGGDEFIVLLDKIDSNEIEDLLEAFENEIKEFNKTNKITLQSAYGYSLYEKGKTYDDMIKEADRNMYLCKKRQKGSIL